jgi:tRNA dimethylallyltransferase
MATGPLLVIVGETASGKSSLATELAKQFKGEIISADAWAVYKGFDIGTAKPSPTEQAAIPHHLIDVAGPTDGFSVAEFKRLAANAIQNILKKNKLPILVGGTGLYIDSVIYNYSFLPAGPAEERRRLDSLSIEDLLELARSKKIETAGIDLRNKRRIVRLIESEGNRPTRSELRPNTLILGIHIPKEELESRITARVDQMLAEGLENEIKQLSERYGWSAEPMKGIGYREWQLYFDGKQSRAELRQRIISNSLQLAKKQRTWFKRNKSIHWINDVAQTTKLVNKFLNK